ncbi:DUF3310 domain-containing protein [Fusobacterium polymorphum]|uniref:HTH cro/C1-type domain-containing protein n=1 Tax=Fusobacterium nucleatum subsp. polymorphum TaxID=76857 RepID=A0A2C6BJC9_FUSNP|nr:DUF3310 domain-containing protein [Fusobacterium polymorphum]PHI04353.1 hypothetical protein CBG52_11370 [Fusobacterium polymorphum]
MHIGRKIKIFRDENKISQTEFATKIGVTQGFLSHLENGRLNVESPTLEKKILVAIGETPDDDLKKDFEKRVELADDNVHSPKHYMIPGCNFESIDIIRQRLGDVGFMFFLEGNVSKYLIRAEKKNGKEDYEKAKKYLSWLVDMQKVIPHELAFNSKEKIAEGCGTDWLNIIGGISIDMKTKKALILNEVFNQLYSANYGKASELIDALLKE